jgi:hypothetical protein
MIREAGHRVALGAMKHCQLWPPENAAKPGRCAISSGLDDLAKADYNTRLWSTDRGRPKWLQAEVEPCAGISVR